MKTGAYGGRCRLSCNRIDEAKAQEVRLFLQRLFDGSASTADMAAPQVVWLSDADMNGAQGGYA
ncbi:MAG: hypothetical protein AAF228_11030 [Pseudomonadota bacterium]